MSLVPVKEARSMSYQVPVLTATNYPVWAVKVKAIMDANGVWETVKPRALGEEPDSKKKNKQALAFLFQAIPEEMVLQMASYTDPKQVWDGLKTRFLGVDRVRTARLLTLKRELESLRMKEGESVHDFATKLTGLTSKARSLGFELEEADLVKRLLDSMPKSFLQIVASIDQCFEFNTMPFDEAVGRLKAYEERIKGVEKEDGIQRGLLLASHEKMHRCKHCGGGSSNRDDFGCGQGRGRGSVRGRDGNERVLTLFRDQNNVEFRHRSAWLFLKDKYKWQNPKSTQARRTRGQLTGDEPEMFGDDAIPRPSGDPRKTKSKRSLASSSSTSSSSKNRVADLMQEQILIDREAKKESMDRELAARLAVCKIQKRSEDLKILTFDTTGMAPEDVAKIEALKEKTRATYFNF
ncbi:putative zinc finger, CCHC-type containing protein [Tanacetum coccineum]|uniref:Zinc finger, CCHC-type containing protein n=1 Tax=Tanacetum coccineum TaxID=301880 RepID=A0ABQ5GZU2_9ASTR